MTINKNKHIIINEMVRIKQLFFSDVTFLFFSNVTFLLTQLRSLNMISIAFDISSSHFNTNLSNRRFSSKQF